jgi:succinate dehydrogenase/fumarate reductase flavoprotein subunit
MTTFDREVDVVVVGSGAAANAAAVGAVNAGASVVMVEKAEQTGGTTAKSSGAYWIPNNAFLRSHGLDDPREDALRLMARLSYPSVYDPDAPSLGLNTRHYELLAAFYDNGSDVIDEMASIGALRSMQQPLFGDQVGDVDWAIPEYHAELPENKAPYGRTLLPDFDLYSGVLGGQEIVNQCQAYLTAHGVEVITGRGVNAIETDGSGRVIGIGAEGSAGAIGIGARRAVVFGSGGFTHDRDKALGYLRGPIFGGCAVPTNTGDLIGMAGALGAELGNMANAFWSQSALEPTLDNAAVGAFEDIFIPFGDSMIIVNKRGERIGNEKVVYQERTQSHFVFDPFRNEYPNLVQFMVFDSAVKDYDQWHMYRYPVPEAGQTAPWLISGDTLEELTTNIAAKLTTIGKRLGVSSRIGPSVRLADDFTANLRTAIARFDQHAESGVDTDFHRGSTPIQLSWGSVPRPDSDRKNTTMRPFAASGPYYCVLLCGGTLDTCGGPITDPSGHILRHGGSPIEGLFGAGNCVASPTGEAYWSAGSTIGPGLTFGYRAGQAAAARH